MVTLEYESHSEFMGIILDAITKKGVSILDD
jgi:hypothetical protein